MSVLDKKLGEQMKTTLEFTEILSIMKDLSEDQISEQFIDLLGRMGVDDMASDEEVTDWYQMFT